MVADIILICLMGISSVSALGAAVFSFLACFQIRDRFNTYHLQGRNHRSFSIKCDSTPMCPFCPYNSIMKCSCDLVQRVDGGKFVK